MTLQQLFNTHDKVPAFVNTGHWDNKQPRQDQIQEEGGISVGEASTLKALKEVTNYSSQGSYGNISSVRMGLKGIRQQAHSKVLAGMLLTQLADAEWKANLTGTQDELSNETKAEMKEEEQRDTDTEFQELLAQLKADVKFKEAKLEAKLQLHVEAQLQKQAEECKAASEEERRAHKSQSEAKRRARREEERRVQKVGQEAENRARIAEELQALKARQDAKRRAKLERRAQKARQEAERRARLEAEREARLAERRAKEARLEAEQKEKQAEVAALEASVTIQHIALRESAMATCGAGIDVRHVQCSSDCCFVSVKNLPKDVKASAVEELFVQQGIARSMFSLLQLRHGPVAETSEARIMMDAEVGRVVAVGLDGSQFGESSILSFTADKVPLLNMMASSSTKNANYITVSWKLPSRIMIASYPSPIDAQNAVAALTDTAYNGRKIRAEIYQGRNKTVSIESSFFVKINGLPPDADPAQVRTHVKATGIRAVKSPTYDLGQLHQTLKERMHGMESYDIAQTNCEKTGNIGGAHVRFSTWEQAKKVYDSLEGIRSDFPFLRARLARPYQFLVHIPLRQYRAQKARWDSIAEREDDNAVLVQITPSSNSSDRILIRVLGEDKTAVGALKVRIENLVAGQKLDESLWHRSFMTAAGRQFLDSIYCQTNAFIRPDWKSQSLILYADNAAYDATIQLIRAEAQRLEALEISVHISRRAIGFFVRKGLPALKEELGEDAAMLDIQPTVCKLVIHSGGEAARRIVNRLIEESRNNFYHTTKDGDGTTCPVCFDTPSAPVLLGCGHLCCAACLRHCLTSAIERKGFPLLCVGDEDRCKVPIAIPIIQRLLSVQQFDRLVEAAVTTYIEKQPDKFRYCATPDCSQIYRCDGNKKSFNCPSCLASVCIACKNLSHEGMTCEEWNLLYDVAEQERRNEEWASTAGAKKCSRCQVFIQKIEGCNRIQCHCGANICWVCLAAFNDSTAAYSHLSDVHGGAH
ncbi:hypothetical protein M378DRAFT_7318 [Amanita muscaria Koide BX008]|uniref:RING-type domain-containing protein n=1 Tax=Amanita muscaria (strain Koide BX008) TaxID=946122 RepID=A0A0C2TT69_AMAMK|nr:hypothetical protein M378DRAFT_7318 [Amanita muscaria Koide BX008]